MELIYFILCSYGITAIVVYSHIFSVPRKYISSQSDWLCELLHCPMCVGFWVGVFVYGLSFYTELFTFELNAVNPFLLGWLSSGTSYILSQLFDDEGIKIKLGANNEH